MTVVAESPMSGGRAGLCQEGGDIGPAGGGGVGGLSRAVIEAEEAIGGDASSSIDPGSLVLGAAVCTLPG